MGGWPPEYEKSSELCVERVDERSLIFFPPRGMYIFDADEHNYDDK